MNGLDKVIERLNHAHAYVDVNDKNIFYYVDCSVIQDYGQVETFDNEHIQLSQIEEGENIVVVSNGKVLLSDPYQFDTIYSIRLQ